MSQEIGTQKKEHHKLHDLFFININRRIYSKLNPLVCGIMQPVDQTAKAQAYVVLLVPSTTGWTLDKLLKPTI